MDRMKAEPNESFKTETTYDIGTRFIITEALLIHEAQDHPLKASSHYSITSSAFITGLHVLIFDGLGATKQSYVDHQLMTVSDC